VSKRNLIGGGAYFTYRKRVELTPVSSTQTEGNSASRSTPDSFSAIIANALS